MWLIGTGNMAWHYANVIRYLGTKFTTIGRGEANATKFEQHFGLPVISGGLAMALQQREAPESAIVAVSVDGLFSATKSLIEAGTKRLLVEKPCSISLEELIQLQEISAAYDASIFVAYNRRFYAGTKRAQEVIAEDGGVTSMHLEISERGFQIAALDQPHHVKERWFLANTTHVCDLAFHLAGLPASITTHTKGETSWHPSGYAFAGCGETSSGALFSYNGNWETPGGWGLELRTSQRTMIFKPLERLVVQRRDGASVEEEVVDESSVTDFKPGLLEQVRAFANGNSTNLCALSAHIAATKTYIRMAGYDR